MKDNMSRFRASADERLIRALKPFVDAYRAQSDPGTSDLDNEQPFSLRVTLGDLRRAAAVSSWMEIG